MLEVRPVDAGEVATALLVMERCILADCLQRPAALPARSWQASRSRVTLATFASEMMEPGVEAYELGADFIRVQFRSERVYWYTYESAGKENVEKMKELAVAGRGLATFISQHAPVRHGCVREADRT